MTSTLYRFPTGQGLVHLLIDPTDHAAPEPSLTSFTDHPNGHSIVHQDHMHSNNDNTINNNNRKTAANATAGAPPSLQIDSVHGTLDLNGSSLGPSILSTRSLLSFRNLVCDFDETITDHDTTSSFDTLAGQIRSDEYQEPQLSWSEILQAYLDDLEKVDCGDLGHLNQKGTQSGQDSQQGREGHGQHEHGLHVHCPQPTKASPPLPPSTPSASSQDQGQHQNHSQDEQPHPHHQAFLNPKTLASIHSDGRKFTPEPELPTPKIPSLQPWVHSQSRKRVAEKVSLDRVYESGNLVGLTSAKIREYGRTQIRLRAGVVEFLRQYVGLQGAAGSGGQHHGDKENNNSGSTQSGPRGELYILSVNWSKDLIRGAMDQVFGSEEATQRYLPDSNLISSNLMFSDECHEILAQRKKSSKGDIGNNNGQNGTDSAETTTATTAKIVTLADKEKAGHKEEEDDGSTHVSNGRVHVHCLTGTDKLHAFQKIQKDYALRHDKTLLDTKWAYLGDSSTDLGCLVEADVGIIIGKSKSLLTECERSGIQVIDLVERL